MSAASAAAPAPPQRRWWGGLFHGLQKIGRSLQLPVAVLPAAGLLLSLGNLLDHYAHGAFWNKTAKVLLAGGKGILDPGLGLPLLFCIGVAIGFARKSDGSTALAAVAGFLVYYSVLKAFPVAGSVTKATPEGVPQNPGVLGGILIGLLTIWLHLPFTFVIVYAARLAIPGELYEAARIDGATRWQAFRRVTLPLLGPAMLIALLFRYIFAFRLFSEAWLLTKGGPARSTEVVAIYLYQEAFSFNAFGPAAATAWIMVLASLLLAGAYVLLLRRGGVAHAH